jgi:hypothetical protein
MKRLLIISALTFAFVFSTSINDISAMGGDPNHYHMWEAGDKCDGYDWVCAEPWDDDCP